MQFIYFQKSTNLFQPMGFMSNTKKSTQILPAGRMCFLYAFSLHILNVHSTVVFEYKATMINEFVTTSGNSIIYDGNLKSTLLEAAVIEE